uniref:Protein-tyrosine phosphatase, receptor/non-receptor type domain-containing protein n=1 Tax=Parastrongyloides trichosuri TaxID=131310 RepID=A0A0N4ZFT2_PARTI
MKLFIFNIVIQVILASHITTTSIFPSAPNDENDGKISYNVSHDSESDVIFVKCPDINYVHTNNFTNFKLNNESYILTGFNYDIKREFVWIAVRKLNLLDSILKVNCGFFERNKEDKVYWEVQINWNNQNSVFKKATKKYGGHVNVYSLIFYGICSYIISDIEVISINKKGQLISINITSYFDVFSKQRIYLFDKTEIGNYDEIFTPCQIYVLYYIKPRIYIEGINSVKASINKKIEVINSKTPYNHEYTVKLGLEEEYDIKNFYDNEEILIQKMKYRNGNIVPMENEFKRRRKFYVDDYDIFNFKYLALNKEGEYDEIVKTIYFGPQDKDIKHSVEIVDIFEAESNIYASCDLDRYKHAYLFDMQVDDKSIPLKDFKFDGETIEGFTMGGDLIFRQIIYEKKLELKCIYQTPDGNITHKKLFVSQKLLEPKMNKYANLTIIDNDSPMNSENFEKLKKQIQEKINKSKEKIRKNYSMVIFILLIVLDFLLILLVIILKFLFASNTDDKEIRKYNN